MVPAMEFHERLTALMSERGLGVLALARKVPCDKAYISRLASGRQQPSPAMAKLLDDMLGAEGDLAASAAHGAGASGQSADAGPGAVGQHCDSGRLRQVGMGEGWQAAALPGHPALRRPDPAPEVAAEPG